MSYSVNNFNGQLLTNINDGAIDTTSTSIKLLGKGVTSYGEAVAENFVHILENFARTSAPSNPLVGQLWYHIDAGGVGNHVMKVCKSISPVEWVSLGGGSSGSSSTSGDFPTSPSDGDFFWDGEQLWVWNNGETKWTLIGPMSTTAENTGISYAGDLVSDGTTFYNVIKVVVNGKIIAIYSDAMASFIPNPPINDGTGNTTGFPRIYGGVTFHEDYKDATPFAPLNASSNPTINKQYDFGSSANRWRTIYTDSLDTNQLSVSGTTISVSNFMRKDTPNIPTANSLDLGATLNPWGTGYFKNMLLLDDSVSTGDGVLRIPVGTTAQRPLSTNIPANVGAIRYNTSTSSFEGKSALSWASFVTKSDDGTLTIPVGTTAERPAAAPTGSIRFNTTLSLFEGKNSAGEWTSFDKKPGYDLPFLAGWTQEFAGVDLTVRTYGRMKLARNLLIEDFIADIGVASAGASIIMDIQRNGSSIFTTKPRFAAGSTTLTVGVLNSAQTSCIAGDTITFVIEQVGSTTKGQKITATVKGSEV